MGLWKALLFAAMMPAATPALAQDGSEAAVARSPANAQRFLSEYIAAQPVAASIVAVEVNGRYSLAALSDPGAQQRFGTINAMTGDGTCSRMMRFQGNHFFDGPRGRIDPEPLDFRVDWRAVETVIVEPRGDLTRVGLLTKPHEISVALTDAAAKRLALAMEFLRAACEPGKDTGF